jgi:hypothetical protein
VRGRRTDCHHSQDAGARNVAQPHADVLLVDALYSPS